MCEEEQSAQTPASSPPDENEQINMRNEECDLCVSPHTPL